MQVYSVKLIHYDKNKDLGKRVSTQYLTGWINNEPIWSDFLTQQKMFMKIDLPRKYVNMINDQLDKQENFNEYTMIDTFDIYPKYFYLHNFTF